MDIVVPIYGVASFLDRCLSTLAAQDYPDTRIILVDDGSIDGSEEIARAHAASQPNFFYHRKENGGLGSARNRGIELADSEFIMFVDGDDTVAPDFVSSMVSAIGDRDLAVCGMDLVDVFGNRVATRPIPDDIDSDPIQRILDSGNECYSVNKIFRLAHLRTNSATFGPDLFEDFAIIPALVASSRSVGFVPDSKYYYLQHPSSIIAGIRRDPERSLEIFRAFDHLSNYKALFADARWDAYQQWSLVTHLFLSRAAEIDRMVDRRKKNALVRRHSEELRSRIPRWAETRRMQEWIRNARGPALRAARWLFVQAYRMGRPELYTGVQALYARVVR